MEKKDVFNTIKGLISEVTPDVNIDGLIEEDSMSDLGINSVERSEIVILLLSHYQIKIPLVELHGLRNLGELAGFVHNKIA